MAHIVRSICGCFVDGGSSTGCRGLRHSWSPILVVAGLLMLSVVSARAAVISARAAVIGLHPMVRGTQVPTMRMPRFGVNCSRCERSVISAASSRSRNDKMGSNLEDHLR
jgi:hypothetical protein